MSLIRRLLQGCGESFHETRILHVYIARGTAGITRYVLELLDDHLLQSNICLPMSTL